ncbi:MAG: FG-GAP repeat domain-containing protein [Nannocystaceae bacterium]|nr:VCBS repeat-containing protein [bacterium]
MKNTLRLSTLVSLASLVACFDPNEPIVLGGASDSSGTTSASETEDGSQSSSNPTDSTSTSSGPSSATGDTTSADVTGDSSDTSPTSAESTGSADYCGLPEPTLSFAEPEVYMQGGSAVSITLADILGSPGPDIIVGDPSESQLIILENNELLADFTVVATLPLGPDGWLPAVGDLTGNGRPDLAAATGDGVWTWISDGDQLSDGQFQTTTHDPTWGTVIANVGGSAFAEVIVQTNPGEGGRLEVFPGQGGGVGSTPTVVPGGRRTPRMLAAELDGDGLVDLIVPRTDSEQETRIDGMDVLLSRGNADAFDFEVLSFETGPTPWGIAIGDFNEDSFTDVLVAHQGASPGDGIVDSVQVWLGDGTGDLAAQPEVDVGDTLGFPAVGDLDCDGHVDAVVASAQGVYILRGDGTGALAPAEQLFDAGVTGSVAVGQLDADDRLDVVVGIAPEGRVEVYYAD